GEIYSSGGHTMERPINLSELEQKLDGEDPDNTDKRRGFALVNVLSAETFDQEHIPGSINIPKGEVAEFERRFDKSKEIIVYCASASCNAGPNTAKALREHGFLNVRDFPGGLKEWKDSGNHVEGAEASPDQPRPSVY